MLSSSTPTLFIPVPTKEWKPNLNIRKLDNINNKSIQKPYITDENLIELTNDNNSSDATAVISAEKQIEAKKRQMMNIALSPGKSLFTTAFMLWMSGSSIQVFSIMMTGMALINPLKAILSINQAFEKFSNDDGIDTKMPKLIFLALQILSLFVALYKCSTMGLLPLTSADWTSYIPNKTILESAGIML